MVSDIEIRLRADIARLQQDMDRARQAVGGGLDKINTAVGKTAGMFAGLAVSVGAVSFVAFVKQSIDAADALNDLSARTKIAATDLAGLEFAAKMSGSTLEGAANAVSKLAVNMGKDAEKFRALGVTAKDPLEAFKQLAEVFKDIQDPQQRAAFGAAALGKSWAEVAPLLDEGAVGIGAMVDRGKQLSGVTDQMVKDAAAFNDKLDEMGFVVRGVGTRLAADLLPMLNLLVDDLTATGDATAKATAEFSPLAEIFRGVVVLGGYITYRFKELGTEIGVATAQVVGLTSAMYSFLTLDFDAGVSKLRGTSAAAALSATEARKASDDFDAWRKKWAELGATARTASTEVGDSAEAAAARAAAAAKKAAEFLKAEELAAARKKAADESARATKKEEDAYRGLISSIKEKINANEMELATGEPLTEMQKMRLKLDQDIEDGTLALTAAHLDEVQALLDILDASQRYAAGVKKVAKAVEDLGTERESALKIATNEAETQERLVAEFGKTKLAIEKVTLARMEERLAQRAALELDEKEVEQLNRLIEAKTRAVAAGSQLEVLEQQKKATEEATEAHREMWESIDRTAHDTFVSIMNGGKNAAQRLKDTLKNTFFDWLYQQTLKKWIINIGTATDSGGLVSGIASMFGAGGATGGSGGFMANASTWISAGKSIYQGFSTGIAGSLGGLVSSFGTAIGSSAVSAFGMGMSSPAAAAVAAELAGGAAGATVGAAGAASAGAGASAAAAVPIVGWIAAAMIAANAVYKQGWDAQNGTMSATGEVLGAPGLVGNKILQGIGMNNTMANMFSGASAISTLFGRRNPRVTSQGLEGALTMDGFSGQTFANIEEKGGLFRSTKRYTQTGALGTEQEKAFEDTMQAIATSVKVFSEVLGVEADVLAGYSKQIKLELTNDATQNQAIISKMLGEVGDELSMRLIPGLNALTKEGETSSTALQRLVGDYQALDAIFGTIGTTFGAVGVGSLEARERLIELGGGVQALAAGVDSFAQTFLTEAQRMAPVQAAVVKGMADMNLAWVDTREEFAAVVLGLDKTTEAGARDFVSLMALQEAFAAVYPEIENTTGALMSSADVLRQRAAILKEFEQVYMTQGEIEREQIDATNLAIYDLLQTRKAEKQAAEDAAVAAKNLAEGMRGAVAESLSHVEDMVQQRMATEKAAFDDVIAGISSSMERVNGRISKLRELASALATAVPVQQTQQQAAAVRQLAAAQVAAALAIARASGVLPSAQSLAPSLKALGAGDTGEFATFQEFQRSQLRAANDINALSQMAVGQLSVEEKTLRVLQDQKYQAEVAYKDQIGVLNLILDNARKQTEDALKGARVLAAIPTALQNIPGALNELTRTIVALQVMTPPPAAGGPAAPPTGTSPPPTGTVVLDQARMLNEIYRELLRRDADAGGLAYYLEELNLRGQSFDQVRQSILSSPEYKALQLTQTTGFASGTQTSTMMQDNNAALLEELQALNERMAKVQTEMEKTAKNTEQSALAGSQMADQFNNVSAGGNVLLMESAK